MLTVATLFWEANENSPKFSRCYDESWVEKLYRGFARNLSQPFRFVCFTDRKREFSEPIRQRRIKAEAPDSSTCIEPYSMGVPMILVGLDTIVTGNCDELADYCMTADRIALPCDPYHPHFACNGVALVPGGWEKIGLTHQGQNDMAWCRSFPHNFIDDLFPGQVQSFKGTVKKSGLGDTKICYFHGLEKPHELPDVAWIKRHWV